MKRMVTWFVGGASALVLTLSVATVGATGPFPGGLTPTMDLPPAPPDPPEPPATNDGPGIYKASCNKCHGPDGLGNTKIGAKHRAEGKKMPDLTVSKLELDKIVEVVTNGVEKTSMKGYKEKLSAEQIALVAAYTKAFKK